MHKLHVFQSMYLIQFSTVHCNTVVSDTETSCFSVTLFFIKTIKCNPEYVTYETRFRCCSDCFVCVLYLTALPVAKII
jgi:hypothetical protein